MNRRKYLSLGIIILGLGFGYYFFERPAQQSPNNESTDTYQVKNVVDGDTIEITRYGKSEKVRLIGVDTPETLDPRKTLQCFGKEASDFSKSSLSQKVVRLEFDPNVGERDKYNRLLAYVWVDGALYNNRLITEGYAHEYTYRSQSYKYQSLFKDSQSLAKTEKVGLWSPATCNGNTK